MSLQLPWYIMVPLALQQRLLLLQELSLTSPSAPARLSVLLLSLLLFLYTLCSSVCFKESSPTPSFSSSSPIGSHILSPVLPPELMCQCHHPLAETPCLHLNWSPGYLQIGLCLCFQPLAQSAPPDSNPSSGEIEHLSLASYLPHRRSCTFIFVFTNAVHSSPVFDNTLLTIGML
ncbi:unnamed protein product [Pleuronectes platessa]|uniref:Uncharacterized protein n=1 Tax=Pleuronectes platessa TaxID=8262 RepID=A0A9N7ZBV3_PLEPL|nr:unnamed protein product [Pleuronectes platessa]